MILKLTCFLIGVAIYILSVQAFKAAVRFTITTYFKALAKHDKEKP